jgi:hypothetical protein
MNTALARGDECDGLIRIKSSQEKSPATEAAGRTAPNGGEACGHDARWRGMETLRGPTGAPGLDARQRRVLVRKVPAHQLVHSLARNLVEFADRLEAAAFLEQLQHDAGALKGVTEGKIDFHAAILDTKQNPWQ